MKAGGCNPDDAIYGHSTSGLSHQQNVVDEMDGRSCDLPRRLNVAGGASHRIGFR